jgi:hypothetical protein
MHHVVLGEAHLDLHRVDHAARVREADQARMLKQIHAAKVAERKPAAARGFIPRIANALGLF